jgi:hypothetical protein
VEEIKKRYIIFAILDLLYLMYLQRDYLDKRLLKTWNLWTIKIFEEPEIYAIYEQIKKEFDEEYILEIEEMYEAFKKKKQFINEGKI